MTLPFDLPLLSRGFAELTPGVRRVGAEAARQVETSLARILGPVTVSARPVPGVPSGRPVTARVPLDLPGLPGPAVLEVEPALVVRLVDRLAGGPGGTVDAAALTPAEATVLELLALAAIDGACAVPVIEAALSPRLGRGLREPASALAIELEVDAAGIRGRGRLLLPHAAVRALRDAPDLEGSALALPGSVRRGVATLAPEELEALAPGDVVLVDEPEGARASLLLPGGLRATGNLEDGSFLVEETTMDERRAQLPVLLEVELARVEVPLSDIARLEPGAVLSLGLDRRGLVTLRAGERAVARGELVDVDGSVGVRILAVEVLP